MNKSEPSLNSPLIDKLVKDVAAIDTSRDMRSEPNTELKVYHTICEDGYRRELVAKDDVETLIAQKVAEAEPNTELTYELNTQQCAEVALYMYAEWEKAMQPPLPIWKSYPEWLRQLKADKE